LAGTTFHGGPGLVLGLGSGVAGTLAAGFAGAPADLAEAAGPRALLARDRGAFWAVSLALGFCAGLLVAAAEGLFAGGVAYLLAGPLGLMFISGLLAGALWFAFFHAAWGSFALARGWLALRRRLPWRLMSFLADAHQRGVLRQAGAVYEFRHLELQRRLASR
jgi:hypothetical protein